MPIGRIAIVAVLLGGLGIATWHAARDYERNAACAEWRPTNEIVSSSIKGMTLRNMTCVRLREAD